MIRGWCPGLHTPMVSGDGLLLRAAPPGGVLSASAARAVADAAERHGNGVIELTQRARLQLRGLTEASAGRCTAALVAAGLGQADPKAEGRRRVIGSSLIGDDPGLASGTGGVIARLEALLLTDATLDGLPDKFSFVVDGGGVLPMDGLRADVMIQIRDGRASVRRGGGVAVPCPTAKAAAEAVKMARLAAGKADPAPRRPAPAGFIAYPGLQRGVFAAAPALGRLDASGLRAVADLAERFGDGTLRMSPWRCLLLPRATAPEKLRQAALALGLIVEQDDPRRRVVACAGRPACASASVDAAGDALRIAPAVPPGALWHVSGCAKGCAHPGPAAATLIGEAGRYRTMREGRPGGAHATLDGALAELLR